jgi:HSP20 family molecular chaperone IbpA
LSAKKETCKEEKKEIAVSGKKTALVPHRKKQTALAPSTYQDLMESFDNAFEKFRQDFSSFLLPSTKALEKIFEAIPETRIAVVDLEDRGKDYFLKAEMPGFKKDDIDIQVYGDAVEISATAGWKYDKKKSSYICKERACESFYRMVELPEEVKVDDVQADLKDGVLEIVLAKKAPKKSRKVAVK